MIRVLSLLALLAALWAGGMTNVTAATPADTDSQTFTVYIFPGDDIQSVVGEYSPGTTFIIGAGIHRNQQIIPRDGDIFIGETGAILNGANLITDFVQSGNLWIIENQTQGGWASGECLDGFPRCAHGEDLFLDDVPLLHVGSINDVGPGRWFFDYDNDRIYMGDNPTGRKVEVSATYGAFLSDNGARDVIIRNLIIEKYAGPGQFGAISGQQSVNWIVEDNTVRLNHGVGVVTGDGMILRRNLITNNGQMGASGMGNNVLVEENEISHNNYAGFATGWEAGGLKLVRTTDVIVRRNFVHNNRGPGLWSDSNNINVIYEDNLVVYNYEAGIFHEISFNASIRRNIVMYNNARPAAWLYGAQILVSSSPDTQIYQNFVVISALGGNAIVVLQQARGQGDFGEFFATNNRVFNNTIVFMGDQGESGVGTDWNNERFWNEAVNTFERNTYYLRPEFIDMRFWGYRDNRRSWREITELFGREVGSILVPYLPSNIGDVPDWGFQAGAS